MSSAEPTEQTGPAVRSHAPHAEHAQRPEHPEHAQRPERSPCPAPMPGLAESARLLADSTTTSTALVADALARIEAAQPHPQCLPPSAGRSRPRGGRRGRPRLAAGERLPLLGRPGRGQGRHRCGGPAHPLRLRRRTAPGHRPTARPSAGCAPPGPSSSARPTPASWASGRSPRALPSAPPATPGTPPTPPAAPPAASAAAVAAGLVPAALGSDGAGSVRIPAAWTHLVGIKPQRGRVSVHPHHDAFQGLTVNGPLARTVADAALLLDAAAGAHPDDFHRPPAVRASDAARRDPGRLRIALAWRPPLTLTGAGPDPRYAGPSPPWPRPWPGSATTSRRPAPGTG